MAIELKSIRPMNVTSIDLLPGPLKDVRAQATKQLAGLLANMFDNTDDALFELADKAGNSDDQTMYFDSMRKVRIKRQSIERLFVQSTQDNFKVCQRSPVAVETEDDSESGGAFSLMQDDQLEESVAIRGMVSKTNTLFAGALPQLVKRIDFLTAQVTIDETNNPVGPGKISDSFQHACQELTLDIRAKLMIYKLFEKHVLEELEELYLAANESLISAGVLPQLKAVKTVGTKEKAKKPVEKKESQVSNEKADAGNNEVFSQLRDLLANRPTQPQDNRNYLPVVDSGPVLSQADLIKILSSVQDQNNATEDGQAVSIDVRHALHQIVQSSAGSMPQAVGRVDDDAMNLVSMLFEYILDDHSLPASMKALLGRLQIPMLKVALLDKSFFSRGAHPARKLLNKLASAALRWNEPKDVSRDPMFNKVNDIVTSILDEFESNVEIFAQLLEDFSQFEGKEERRSALIEQRTRDAEEGLGKTQRARADVGKLINEKAADKSLPPVVVELLREGWANYLFLVYVKKGTQDESWQAGVQVVDDLIWSVDKDTSFSHRSDLLKMIPSLLQRLREGLNSISFSKNRMRGLFSTLEAVHMDCLKAAGSEPQTGTVNRVAESDESDLTAETVETANIIVETPELEPLDESITVDAGDAKFADLVDSMAVGAWLEFVGEQGVKSRCKLAAIIRASGKYIFVNRVGIKVAEHTRSSLIEAVREGQINMLDNALLFDRALESVIGHLREMKD